MVAISMQKIQAPSPRIFVFGSNLAGRHGKGAALHARIYYGAQYGVAVGHLGQSYAIPTKDQNLVSLDLGTIKHHVEGFIAYAKANPTLAFNVTQIGGGLAGYKPYQIAPMFAESTMNCWYDTAWRPYFNIPRNYWEEGTLCPLNKYRKPTNSLINARVSLRHSRGGRVLKSVGCLSP